MSAGHVFPPEDGAAEILAGLVPAGSEGAGAPSASSPLYTFHETEPDYADSDALLLARSYFDVGEFARAAHTLDASCRDTASASTVADVSKLSPKALALRCYSLYMAGEKRKEEQIAEEADTPAVTAVNKELPELQRLLKQLYDAGNLDAFGLYIYGIVLKELRDPAGARQMLCQSVSAYPLNWSAWLDLASLCTNKETLDAIQPLLPRSHWSVDFFTAHALLEMQSNADALAIYEKLAARFPNSPYLKGQIAQALYNMREFDSAQRAYEQIRKEDPHRIDGMDCYSNILYVKEAKAELSFLAHETFQLDKFRAESCCIVGNYYSLRAQHEQAIVYFRRALKANPRYLSAWTLMGHEFVELKNAGAAIEAYRHAVDINPLDYRAWYGLGQTYEIMKMHTYAVYYYRKATALRPYDPRMWCAMAGCYESLSKDDEAMKCYERAACHDDREGIATLKLAKLHRARGNNILAASCYRDHIAAHEVEDADFTGASMDTAQALMFLGNYAKAEGKLDEAIRYAELVLCTAWPSEVSEAKSLLREIKSIRDRMQSPDGMSVSPASGAAPFRSPATSSKPGSSKVSPLLVTKKRPHKPGK